MQIVGIDEVGRGCWAGPLVAGAVVLRSKTIEGLRDSKKLSPRQRQALDVHIRAEALAFGLGWVFPAELDQIGLTAAVRLAMERALQDVHVPYDRVIIDGNYNFLAHLPSTQAMVRADDAVPAASAASILAKVARDLYMATQAGQYPEYGFATHVGYGTAAHRAALDTYGLTPLHRRRFKPIAAFTEA